MGGSPTAAPDPSRLSFSSACLLVVSREPETTPMLPTLLLALLPGADAAPAPADLIIHNARVVTVDAKFSLAQAVALRDGKVLAVGDDKAVLEHKGPKTRVIDAKDKMVLPGLMDSHTHPYSCVTTEL